MSVDKINLSKSKRIIFTGVMLLLPAILFLIMELFLTMVNYGGNLKIFITHEQSGKKEYLLNKNFTHRYFFKKGIEAPNPRTQIFSYIKDKNTYRIFCLGASTTQGVPYPPNAAFPAMLKNILQTLHPDKNFEVINCGVTAITSHSVLDMGREIISDYDPDLLVVYSGHNEFYGVFGQASRLSLFRSRTLTQWFLKLQRLRTFLLARDIYIKIFGEKLTRESVVDPGTFMGTVAREAGIPENSPVFKRTTDQFGENIEALIIAAKRAKKDILVCNLVDNLKDLKPFESLHAPEFPESAQQKYNTKLQGAGILLQQDKPDQALDELDKVLNEDSLFAETHYLLGKCYYTLGQFSMAKSQFVRAKDLDVIRFRAPSQFNVIIKNICQKYPGTLVDVESAFENDSPHQIIGNNLILEHIHPTERGYYLMARVIATTMSQSGLVAPDWDWSLDKSDSAYLAMNNLSLLSREIVNAAIFRLTSHWPFPKANQERKYQKTGTARTEELALAYTSHRQGSLIRLHLDLGYEYFMKNDLKNALSEYRAALAIEPNCEGYNLISLLYSREVERLRKVPGNVRAALQNFQNASYYFDQGLSECPDDIELNYNRGALYSLLKQGLDQSILSFQKVLSLNPSHKNARLGLTGVYLQKGDIKSATANLRKAINISPREPDYYKELARILIMTKNFTQAKTYVETGISLNNSDPELQSLLKRLESEK